MSSSDKVVPEWIINSSCNCQDMHVQHNVDPSVSSLLEYVVKHSSISLSLQQNLQAQKSIQFLDADYTLWE